MPEGPEIRRAADEIAQVLEGKITQKVSFSQPAMRRHGRRFSGHEVLEIETRGKAMLTHFDHGWTIYSHNQLYGVWAVYPLGRIAKTNRSLRLRLTTATHEALLYSASDISIWPTRDIDEHPFLARIGPDILSRSLDWRGVAERLGHPDFARRQLGALYLDQSFIAGLGNYLRAEILFDARLHPALRPADLSRGELGRLARSTLELSLRSYKTGGITNTPSRARKLAAAGATFGQRRFAVFGREALGCYQCGQAVKRQEMNSRRIYLCTTCQPPA